MTTPTQQRPARPGEKCTCGRPAVIVYLTERYGEIGYCGIPDGGRDRAIEDLAWDAEA